MTCLRSLRQLTRTSRLWGKYYLDPSKRHKSTVKPEQAQESYRQRLLFRIQARTPTFLHRYTGKLVNAPVTHLTSFLVLHEITAIVPLFGLATLFHYTDWLPERARHSRWASEGTGKYANWFIKKGWLRKVEDGEDISGLGGLWWQMGDARFKVVVEIATAYAITKVLLPARLFLCFYGTPWFARRFIEPLKLGFRWAFVKQKA